MLTAGGSAYGAEQNPGRQHGDQREPVENHGQPTLQKRVSGEGAAVNVIKGELREHEKHEGESDFHGGLT
jgi:hypothetical protein